MVQLCGPALRSAGAAARAMPLRCAAPLRLRLRLRASEPPRRWPAAPVQQRLYSSAAAAADVRNVAIIAHVDHGKTTLMDKLLLSCEENGAQHAAAMLEGDRIVDSMDQERERGITIVSKVCGLVWGGVRLNLVDTPGHADFGGEVERVLRMVDGVVLVVDATDGPNTQTTFVTEKALQHGLRPLVVLNKCDRETARVSDVEDEIFDLLEGLGATDEQLDFEFVYASARDGWAVAEIEERPADPGAGDMTALMDAIVAAVPPPQERAEEEQEEFALCISMTSSDPFVGKLATGRVASGAIALGQPVLAFPRESEAGQVAGKVKEIRAARGMEWASVEAAAVGDIIQLAVTGGGGWAVGDTIGSEGLSAALPAPAVDPPTIAMTFSQNDSPWFGREGSKLTGELLKERLQFETENNISIVVEPAESAENVEVCARGEMQLGVLIETLRREGFELSVSPPRVLYKEDGEGGRLEPMEEVTAEVDEEQAGTVIEQLTARLGTMLEMTNHAPRVANGPGRARLTYTVPSRGLVGYGAVFQAMTRGTGVLNRRHVGYEPHRGALSSTVRNGAIVSTAEGKATGYALQDIQERGALFIGPKEEVYEGQIIGEGARVEMLNVSRAAQL